VTEALHQEIRTLKDIFESERDPEGRVFAPLADAFRRAGEVQQAVRLLNEGLVRHPQFVPGHVVAAQLYVEQGLAEEAAIAARNALALDAENVNALQSLLRVLEEKGDAEAADVGARLAALDPNFSGGGADAAPTTRRPPVEDASAVAVVDVEVEPEELAVDGDAETVEIEALGGGGPAALQATAALGALVPEALDDALDFEPPADESLLDIPKGDSSLDLMPDMTSAGEEPVIDLDLLAPTSPAEDVEEPIGLAELVPETETELAVEEPIIDLDLLAPVTEEEGFGGVMALTDLAPAPDVDLPTEEPVIDLDALAPVETLGDEGVWSLSDLAPDPAEEILEFTDLAPDPAEEILELGDLAPEPAEEVLDLADLAPEPAEGLVDLADLAPSVVDDAMVVDLGDLAPDLALEEDEKPVSLADLAPEPEPDEAVMNLADLAPEAAASESVMDLADLAPSTEVDEDTMVMDLGALAPDAIAEPQDEAVWLADLAPDEEDEVVALTDLAPEVESGEAVMDFVDLAPDNHEVDAEPEMELADRAPDAEVEPADAVLDLMDLAPDVDGASEEDVIDLGELAPESVTAAEDESALTMMDLMGRAPETADKPEPGAEESDEIVIDLDALSPARSSAETEAVPDDEVDGSASDGDGHSDEAADEAAPAEPDDNGLGEPVYTRTLGELYVKQGATDQAIEVFRHLTSVSPGDAEIARRLEEIESGASLDEEETAKPDQEVERLARDLAEGGNGTHDVESPFAWADEGGGGTEDAEPGPTIGDYFEGLLTWKPGKKP
jgi:hypothetical protein